VAGKVFNSYLNTARTNLKKRYEMRQKIYKIVKMLILLSLRNAIQAQQSQQNQKENKNLLT